MSSAALFSPFWGGNLGDSAILKAIAENLRCLQSDLSISAITMDVAATAQQQGLSGIPLYGGRIRMFSTFDAPKPTPVQIIDRMILLPSEIGRTARWIFDEVRHGIIAMRFLRKVDLLVIAGGGQLDEEWGGPWGLPYSLFKWTLAARLSGTSVVVLSVGVCKLESRLSRWFCRRALRSSSHVSVRDPWSLSFVRNKLGVVDAILMPDAAFSLPLGHVASADVTAPAYVIGVSPIAFGKKGVWPTEADAVATNYFETLGELIYRFIANGNIVRLFATDGPDGAVMDDLYSHLESKYGSAILRRLQIDRVTCVQDALSLVCSVDLVVASRLHGVILSHLVHTPVVAVSYDRKVTAHMDMVGQSGLCTPIEGISLATVLELSQSALSNRNELAQQIASKISPWRGLLAEQYLKILHLLH